jgi:diphosphomevalonate decarboxylase
VSGTEEFLISDMSKRKKDFHLTSGEVAWQSPSNIALVKYWGKRGFQIPANPSLSMTLSESFTETTVKFRPAADSGNPVLDFYFDGKINQDFAQKILAWFKNIQVELPFINQLDFEIHSHNTFPHSAGIASSASSMSALALCIVSIEQQFSGNAPIPDQAFYSRAAYFARIGSGSASRSVYGQMASWGKAAAIPGSSDLTATPYSLPLHPVFENLRDTILIVSKGEKKVSSRAGHALMEKNPFAAARYRQASGNLDKLIKVLASGDLDAFISIVEAEALTLHGMMMASKPGYILMEPNTLEIIKKIQAFREHSDAKLCFTLDAGPNVHVLFPENDSDRVRDFLMEYLKPLCDSYRLIEDKMGSGPKRIK